MRQANWIIGFTTGLEISLAALAFVTGEARFGLPAAFGALVTVALNALVVTTNIDDENRRSR